MARRSDVGHALHPHLPRFRVVEVVRRIVQVEPLAPRFAAAVIGAVAQRVVRAGAAAQRSLRVLHEPVPQAVDSPRPVRLRVNVAFRFRVECLHFATALRDLCLRRCYRVR